MYLYVRLYYYSVHICIYAHVYIYVQFLLHTTYACIVYIHPTMNIRRI